MDAHSHPTGHLSMNPLGQKWSKLALMKEALICIKKLHSSKVKSFAVFLLWCKFSVLLMISYSTRIFLYILCYFSLPPPPVPVSLIYDVNEMLQEHNIIIWFGSLYKELLEVPTVAQQSRGRLVSIRMQVRSLNLLGGLRIQRCHELWYRSQTGLRSRAAVA